MRVDFENGLLSVKAESATQQQILEEINRKTGGKLVVEKDAGTRSVSLSFQKLPLLQGVKRVLPNASHVVLYDRSGAVEAIFIVADGKAAANVSKGSAIGKTAPRAGERQEILANVPEPPAGPEPAVPGVQPRRPEPKGEGEAPERPVEALAPETQIPKMPLSGAEISTPEGASPMAPVIIQPPSVPGMPGMPAARNKNIEK